MNKTATFVLSDVELGALSVVNVLFSIGGSLGNIMVCVAFLSHRNLRSIMNIFILSLAFSDLIICLVAQPMFVVSLSKNYQQGSVGNLFEDIRKRLTWISMLASAGNLLGVTLDRYVAISSPLRYSARMTSTRVLVFVFFVWAVAISLGSTTEFNLRMKIIGQIYVLVLLLFIICPLYCHVLWIARKHARVIQSVMSHMAMFERNNCVKDDRLSTSIVRKADRNSLKTVGIISSIFFLGWFPLLILPFVYLVVGSGMNQMVFLEVFQWINTLALCSAACNPIVYSWRDRRFRKALLLTYSRWTAKRIISLQDNRLSVDGNRNSVSQSSPG